MTHLSILKKSIKYNSNPFHHSHSPIHLKYPKNITFHPLSISKESIECTPIFLTKIEENQNVDTLKMNPNPSSIVPPSLRPKHPKNITFLARYSSNSKRNIAQSENQISPADSSRTIYESSSARATPHCRANASSFGKRSVDLEVMVFHKSRAGEGRE